MYHDRVLQRITTLDFSKVHRFETSLKRAVAAIADHAATRAANAVAENAAPRAAASMAEHAVPRAAAAIYEHVVPRAVAAIAEHAAPCTTAVISEYAAPRALSAFVEHLGHPADAEPPPYPHPVTWQCHPQAVCVALAKRERVPPVLCM